MFTQNTGLIIPTRNRPSNLFSTLQYFSENKIKFFKTIVIDSSNENFKKEIVTICNKFNVNLFFSKPSTSQQRNLGLKKFRKEKVKFIMFLDDDLKFYKNSFKIMNLYIKKYNNNYTGFCFNHIHRIKKKSLFEKIKTSKFIEKLGLYSSDNGRVLDSGWQTKIQNLNFFLKSQWLPTSSSIFKKKTLNGKYFQKSFGAYSYLEDLDFSLQLNPSRKFCFLVVSGAKFSHTKEIIRTSFGFGYYEFVNRYKIVKKFHLKKTSFYVMAIFKIILTIFSILMNYKNIFKLLGNIIAIISCLIFV